MKILVCYDDRLRADSTGVYFLEALRKMGHDVNLAYPEILETVKPGDFDFYLAVDHGLRFIWPKHLKPSAFYIIDTHIETDWRLKIAEDGDFDNIYVCHRDGLKLHWKQKAHWLPVGCDPEKHYAGKKNKVYDACFIGNFHSSYAERRVEMVDQLFKSAPNFFFGNRTFRDMAEKYAESKIVFNCSLNNDANMRVFEAMCSGSCLLTDRIEDLTALGFVEGVHYEGYSSKDELKDKVALLLKDEDYRERIAGQGREEVLKKHTYAHRCEVILKSLEVLCQH